MGLLVEPQYSVGPCNVLRSLQLHFKPLHPNLETIHRLNSRIINNQENHQDDVDDDNENDYDDNNKYDDDDDDYDE